MEQSLLMDHSFENRSQGQRTHRSILTHSALRQRAFLPYGYRTENTMESIRQQRVHKKTSLVLSKQCPRRSNLLSARIDAFGNVINPMNQLSEQRLVLRENSMRKKHNSPHMDEFYSISTANFVGDIPSSLELIVRDTKQKSTMEQNLFESMRRERLQQGRYRLLPITRAGHR